MNHPSASSDPEAQFKEEAAKHAVHFVRSGMKVGLGTGSTAICATRRMAELLKRGEGCERCLMPRAPSCSVSRSGEDFIRASSTG